MWVRFASLSGLEHMEGPHTSLLSLMLTKPADPDSEPQCAEPEGAGKFLGL